MKIPNLPRLTTRCHNWQRDVPRAKGDYFKKKFWKKYDRKKFIRNFLKTL